MEVTLYTRRNCHLCDEAKRVLHAAGITPREIDIDSDGELQRRFTNDVPVIFVDGREAFRHRVDADELRRLAMSGLAAETCVPCRGGVPPLAGEELERLLAELNSERGGWRVVDGHHLEKDYTFPDFRQALDFVNRVGELAEEQGHHPDLSLSWGKARFTTWTHKIDGLTESDFVLAAKADRLA